MAEIVLVVDDSMVVRHLVSLTLKREGYIVIEAVNGKDALDKLNDGKTRIDIFITDIYMPEMDGIELIKQLRKKHEYRFTPVIMLTTASQEDKKQEGKRAGASGWISKPFDAKYLIDTVKKFRGWRTQYEEVQRKGILVVDDETAFLMAAKRLLQCTELFVDTAETLEEAEALISKKDFSVVVTDVRLTNSTSEEGFEILRYVKEVKSGTKVIMLTGYGNDEVRERAYAMGAHLYLEKPLSTNVLKGLVETLTAQQ